MAKARRALIFPKTVGGEWVKCDRCFGYGEDICQECEGEGCLNCQEWGFSDCRTCYGTGEIRLDDLGSGM